MPKAAATAASNAATAMRNTARAITLRRQTACRRAIALGGCIAGFSAPCLSPPRPPDASDSGSCARPDQLVVRHTAACRLRLLRRRETKVLSPAFASNHHLVGNSSGLSVPGREMPGQLDADKHGSVPAAWL